MSLVVLHRIFAFWKVDLTDSQVVGFLPSDITGIEALMYIFSGPDGLMLGLLFGFSIGLAIRTKKNHEYRWAAFIWILIFLHPLDSLIENNSLLVDHFCSG